MSKKNRLIILCIFAILFLIITPYIVMYSLGYRVDVKKFKVFATGGIYIKALPQGANITIDSIINNTTSVFSPAVFEQNLLPGNHTILIRKDGYFDYSKNLPVLEKEVTKLEHVSLFKQNIPFTLLKTGVTNFYTAPNQTDMLLAESTGQNPALWMLNISTGVRQSLEITVSGKAIGDVIWSPDSNKALINTNGNYFLLQPFLQKPTLTPVLYLAGSNNALFNPQNTGQIFYLKNKNLFVSGEPLPILKNVAAYQINNNTITYLSYDGFVYDTGITATTANKINTVALAINSNNEYKILNNLPVLLIKENDKVFLLNKNSGTLENLYTPVKEIKLSPDGQKILYYNDYEILYSDMSKDINDKIFLNRFSEKIKDAYWLGNDYVVFILGDNIVISEIDVRGNINMVTLPNTMALNDGSKLTIQNPKIYADQADKKLYMLTQSSFASSERLVP